MPAVNLDREEDSRPLSMKIFDEDSTLNPNGRVQSDGIGKKNGRHCLKIGTD